MADELIEEIRRTRHDMSARHDHDIHKVLADYRQFQEELRRSGQYRFVARPFADRPRGGSSHAAPMPGR